MMLKEIKEMLECDVLGNDEDYINKLNLTDDDYYKIRRMADAIKYNISIKYRGYLACACAMLVYLVHKGKTDEIGLGCLRDDLEDNIDNCFSVLYSKAYEELQHIKREEEENATENSSSDS